MASETSTSMAPVMKEKYMTIKNSGHRSTHSDYSKRSKSKVIKRLSRKGQRGY